MMMRKLLVSVFICVLFSVSTVFAESNNPIKVFIDGNLTSFSEQPFIENDVTMVQFRPIFEKLGLRIEWNAETKTIIGRSDNLIIKLTIGSNKAVVNDEIKTLVLAPRIVSSGNTMIPLRFVSEASGGKVLWDGINKIITISSGLAVDSNGVTIELEDGSKYVGQQVNNLADGQGTFDWNNGNKYVGEFKEGRIEGYGTYYYSNGTKYVGFFINGLRNGNATFYWANGDKFIGEFKNDVRSGFGTYYSSDGKIINQGNYENDKLVDYSTPTPIPTSTPVPSAPTVTPAPTQSPYAIARNTQLLNELATLQQTLTNVQNEKNVKIYQDGSFVWVADPTKVEQAKTAYQTALDYYNVWKTIWGF